MKRTMSQKEHLLKGFPRDEEGAPCWVKAVILLW